MNVNKVVIAGTLLEDPALKKTRGGTAVSTVVLQITREWEKDGQPQSETSEVEVDVYGRLAETLNQYLHKGDPVMFEGHLKLEKWEYQSQQCSRLIVVAESLQFVSQKEGSGGGGSRRTQSTGERPAGE
jgi:single-strand DNA-binding protein